MSKINRIDSAMQLANVAKPAQIKLIYLASALAITLSACGSSSTSNPVNNTTSHTDPVLNTIVKGADVSWVTQEESAGYKFYNEHGVSADPFVLLNNLGVKAIRLRVWVDPTGGWNNAADTLAKAQRAAALGQRIMIDFHYSDSWADPFKQPIPRAWENHSISQLQTDVYQHTREVLSILKTKGIAVEWVQVGNEINTGMLWPKGKVNGDDFSTLALLINSGTSAVKAVYPEAKVVLHLAFGEDNAVFRWFFDGMKAKGVNYDAIGLSHYPSPSNWPAGNNRINANMKDMISRYNKPVMIAEVGMEWQQAAAAKAMLSDLKTKVSTLPPNYGIGIFYWEPASYPGWGEYDKGALNQTGQFTDAMKY